MEHQACVPGEGTAQRSRRLRPTTPSRHLQGLGTKGIRTMSPVLPQSQYPTPTSLLVVSLSATPSSHLQAPGPSPQCPTWASELLPCFLTWLPCPDLTHPFAGWGMPPPTSSHPMNHTTGPGSSKQVSWITSGHSPVHPASASTGHTHPPRAGNQFLFQAGLQLAA